MAFPVRKQKFNFSSVPLDWFDENVVSSTFWDALSLTFPEGEAFFVRAVKPHKDKVVSKELKEDIINFIGQEAAHGRQHRVLNKALNEQGFKNIEELEKEVRAVLVFAHKNLPNNVQLAATCALEHFTATLAEQLILEPEHLEMADKSIRNLWAWHAIEESEHKHVAYDVYQEIYGDYLVRVVTMIIVTALLGLVVFTFQVRLLSQVYYQFDVEGWKGLSNYLLKEGGLAEKVLPLYLDYFKPNFHPSQTTTPELIKLRESLLRKI